MSAYVQANTSGRLHDATEPTVSPLNRGFLYGDAIYEVWRTYHGVIFAWEEHWRRLERSAAALHLQIPLSAAQMLVEIRRTVDAFRTRIPGTADLYIRLQLTRGGGAIGLDTALADKPEWVLLVQENKLYSPDKYAAGLRLSVAKNLRRNAAHTLNPAWKTGNYLNNLLCLREARARGADEVVILNLDGAVTEAAVSNIAFVRGGAVVTPTAGAGILLGITRELVIGKVAPAAGIRVELEDIRPEEFASCEECFLLSTTKDITPVAAIDDHRFRLGGDTVTAKLKAAFAAFAREQAEARPDMRLFAAQ
ncbi:aminotransferase class IV [Nibricoccus sp. IMCC34717]|uniref:aminotransferase class IV n=1 Tax=Nibricoccus sp. IMCC34717 TaxID=3034021 RepID=UPI00384AE5B2